jgi:hypothetical protein
VKSGDPYVRFYLRLWLSKETGAGADMTFPDMAWNTKAECWDFFSSNAPLRGVPRIEREVFDVMKTFVATKKIRGIRGPVSGHLKAMLHWTEQTAMMEYIPSATLLRLLSDAEIGFSVSVYATSTESTPEE